MAARDNLLGPHEQLVLLAIMRIGNDAYGMTIRREVEQRADRRLSIGAVYTTLERLLNAQIDFSEAENARSLLKRLGG